MDTAPAKTTEQKSRGNDVVPGLQKAIPIPTLRANRLGCAVGATATLFYLACMLVMTMLPRETATVFFNSLLHGVDVGPILRIRVPTYEVVIGLISTFILGWIAGALVAAFYNWGLDRSPLAGGFRERQTPEPS